MLLVTQTALQILNFGHCPYKVAGRSKKNPILLLPRKSNKSAADTLENNARIPTLEGMERYRVSEIWSNSHPMPQEYDWFSTFVHEMGHFKYTLKRGQSRWATSSAR